MKPNTSIGGGLPKQFGKGFFTVEADKFFTT